MLWKAVCCPHTIVGLCSLLFLSVQRMDRAVPMVGQVSVISSVSDIIIADRDSSVIVVFYINLIVEGGGVVSCRIRKAIRPGSLYVVDYKFVSCRIVVP